jgi:hypothetical protein
MPLFGDYINQIQCCNIDINELSSREIKEKKVFLKILIYANISNH